MTQTFSGATFLLFTVGLGLAACATVRPPAVRESSPPAPPSAIGNLTHRRLYRWQHKPLSLVDAGGMLRMRFGGVDYAVATRSFGSRA